MRFYKFFALYYYIVHDHLENPCLRKGRWQYMENHLYEVILF